MLIRCKAMCSKLCFCFKQKRAYEVRISDCSSDVCSSDLVEFLGAWAERVGEEGRGVSTILQMVALTRLDCMIGSSRLMRQATVQAIHHARHRKVFGQLLAYPALLHNVLADLALESDRSNIG